MAYVVGSKSWDRKLKFFKQKSASASLCVLTVSTLAQTSPKWKIFNHEICTFGKILRQTNFFWGGEVQESQLPLRRRHCIKVRCYRCRLLQNISQCRHNRYFIHTLRYKINYNIQQKLEYFASID